MVSKVLMSQDGLFFIVCLNYVTHNYNKINLADWGGEGLGHSTLLLQAKPAEHIDVNIHYVCFVPACVTVVADNREDKSNLPIEYFT